MQAELFSPPQSEYKEIALTEFPNYASKPTPQMVASVKRLGVLEPVIMRGTVLVAGRRRVEAARKAGLITVPARVYPDDFSNEYILSLVENEQRRHNPLSDLKSVEALLEQGKEEKDITQHTGISPQRLKKILKVRDLIPILRRAFEDGIIKHSVALAAAKKPKKIQEKLLDVLEEEGQLRLKDVQRVCKVERKEAVAALPDDLFSSIMPDWKPNTLIRLQDARREAEKDADPDWLDTLDALIEELK